jgi:hypothetical protein
MENKKQSSIEWLELEIKNFNTVITKEYLLKLIEKAKEIHKQEIIDACEEFGNLNGVDIEDYTEYYNQNFNQQ